MPNIPRLRVRRIDIDDKPLTLFGIGDDFAQSLRQLVKRVVEEVEAEDVGIEEIGPVAGTFAHHIDILLVECGCPDAILVRETGEQIPRAGAAIPYIAFVLPVHAKGSGKVLLRLLDPDCGREVRALALAHVLRHEQVEAGDDKVPVFAPGRTLVSSPEHGVCVNAAGLEPERKAEIKLVLVLAVYAIRQTRVRVEGDVKVGGGTVIGHFGRAVVVHIHLGEEEVAIVERVFLLEDVPWRVDVRPHLAAPLLVDEGEVVAVDGRGERGGFARGEVAGNERLDFRVVRAEAEHGNLVGGNRAAHGLDRLLIDGGRRLRPVEVIDIEDGQHVVVFDKRDLFRVEATDEARRLDVALLFALYCEDQLREHAVDVSRMVLGLRPEDRRIRQKRHLAHIAPLCAYAEVDVADDARAVELSEERGGDAVLQLLLTN